MWDIIYLIKDFFRSSSIQDFINKRWDDKPKLIINPVHFQKIVTEDGYTFPLDEEFNNWKDIFDDYHYNDIRPDDIVVDIGSNIGVFTSMAYRRSKHVTCVEPIKIRQLHHNLQNNNIKVSVISQPFGDGSPVNITWLGNSYNGPSVTWKEILKVSGGCDFLKCDCEGGEWFFTIEDLKNIRRIEMEVHRKNLNPRDDTDIPYIVQLEKTHDITKKWILNNDTLYILSATRKYYFNSQDNQEICK